MKGWIQIGERIPRGKTTHSTLKPVIRDFPGHGHWRSPPQLHDLELLSRGTVRKIITRAGALHARSRLPRHAPHLMAHSRLFVPRLAIANRSDAVRFNIQDLIRAGTGKTFGAALDPATTHVFSCAGTRKMIAFPSVIVRQDNRRIPPRWALSRYLRRVASRPMSRQRSSKGTFTSKSTGKDSDGRRSHDTRGYACARCSRKRTDVAGVRSGGAEQSALCDKDACAGGGRRNRNTVGLFNEPRSGSAYARERDSIVKVNRAKETPTSSWEFFPRGACGLRLQAKNFSFVKEHGRKSLRGPPLDWRT